MENNKKTSTLKKVTIVELVVFILFSILEIITAIRVGRTINFTAMTVLFSLVTIGFSSIEKDKEADLTGKPTLNA